MVDKVTIKNIAEANPTPCQTPEMDSFARTFNKLEPKNLKNLKTM